MLSYLANISYMKTNALPIVDAAVPTRLPNSLGNDYMPISYQVSDTHQKQEKQMGSLRWAFQP